MARIVSVNISNRKGEKKHSVASAPALADQGLQDDAHSGMKLRQISLLAAESIDKIRRKGLPVQPGDFAENLTTEGIELFTLPLGTKIRIGADVVVEVTQIGKTCLAPCAIYAAVGECVMPREGIFARILSGGVIAAGDELVVVR
ncbi:MAG: MOSC domain-containing protein [Smithellaceae bacterium]|nr:MOSC domain-containing protein [Smithellaceae bacterium]